MINLGTVLKTSVGNVGWILFLLPGTCTDVPYSTVAFVTSYPRLTRNLEENDWLFSNFT